MELVASVLSIDGQYWTCYINSFHLQENDHHYLNADFPKDFDHF